MAEGTRFARLEENLTRLAALQESQAILLEKQNLSIDSLTTLVKEITVGLQTLDGKVEQQWRSLPSMSMQPQQPPPGSLHSRSVINQSGASTIL